MKTMHYKTPIETERYVYHISYKCYREQIQANGLKANSKPNSIGYTNAVFAHNHSILDINWYPLTLDWYGWFFYCSETETEENLDFNDMVLRKFEDCYDVWRIDTHKLNRQWFRDDVGENEFEKGIFRPETLYIVAFGDIPSECITLARLKPHFTRRKFDWGIVQMRTLRPVA